MEAVLVITAGAAVLALGLRQVVVEHLAIARIYARESRARELTNSR